METTFSPGRTHPHNMQQTLYAEREPIMIMRGDLFSACLDPVVGSEQGGIRPVLVVQNDVGNRYSPTVIVLAITGQVNKTKLPTHVEIGALGNGLSRNSVVLMEQLRTIDKRRLKEKIGHIDEPSIRRVQSALTVSLGMGN